MTAMPDQSNNKQDCARHTTHHLLIALQPYDYRQDAYFFIGLLGLSSFLKKRRYVVMLTRRTE